MASSGLYQPQENSSALQDENRDLKAEVFALKEKNAKDADRHRKVLE